MSVEDSHEEAVESLREQIQSLTAERDALRERLQRAQARLENSPCGNCGGLGERHYRDCPWREERADGR